MKKSELEGLVGGELYTRAKEVLGNSNSVVRWFSNPKIAFDGKTPLELCKTNDRQKVYDLLERIENGVFY
jgi:uncharacterized protein (DUF2384 family)